MGFWSWLNATYDDVEVTDAPSEEEARTDELCARCMKAALEGFAAFKNVAPLNGNGTPSPTARAMVEFVYFMMFYCHAKAGRRSSKVSKQSFYYKFLHNTGVAFASNVREREAVEAYFLRSLDNAAAEYTRCKAVWNENEGGMLHMLLRRLQAFTPVSVNTAAQPVRRQLEGAILAEGIDAALAAVLKL